MGERALNGNDPRSISRTLGDFIQKRSDFTSGLSGWAYRNQQVMWFFHYQCFINSRYPRYNK